MSTTSTKDFIKIDRKSGGPGKQTIYIDISQNKTWDIRRCTVTLTSLGKGEQFKFDIVQNQTSIPPIEGIEEFETWYVDSDGEMIDFSFYANTKWKLSADAVIKLFPSTTSGDTGWYSTWITIDENNTATTRVLYLTITAANKEYNIAFVQDGNYKAPGMDWVV